MVVRRTDKRDIGLTAAAWLEDRTTTTYQPSHLRPRATTRRPNVPPPPPVFGPRSLTPALAGAASSRATNMYAPAPSPRLTLPTAALRGLDAHDNPFARPRGAAGASFWNALAFAGLFASVLVGRVIVQAGQEVAQAATPRAAATQAAASQGPTGAAPQDSGAGGVGVNALAPGADRLSQEQPLEPAQPAAAPGNQTPSSQPAAASAAAQPAAAANATAQPAAAPVEATSQPTAAKPAGTEAATNAPHSKYTQSTPHAHRGHAARTRTESLDWRQERAPTPLVAPRTPEPAPLPAAKPAVADPSAALGTLRINSRPWSQVFIDGRLVGNTPQLGLRLPAGRYTVRLANPELGMTKTLIVNVSAGELVSRVETLEEP